MRPENIQHRTLLIAPLDWGMGHVTRCIPLMHQLISQSNELIFAGTKDQIELIRKDFPELGIEQIQGYNISLDSKSSSYAQMLKQFKGMRKMVMEEQRIALQLVKKYEVDVIISDNRYGFHNPETLNIFVTHQLNPQIPIFRKRVRNLIRYYISKFDHCWIPDKQEEPTCGELLVSNLSIPIHYIGYLSRFRRSHPNCTTKFLVIISGPEPERSRFMKRINDIFSRKGDSYKIVAPIAFKEYPDIIVNPATEELEELLGEAKLVISRAGYTTIMEMISLEKNAILIPTSGQYEQEYLARIVQHPKLRFASEDQLEMFIGSVNINGKEQ